MPFETSELSHYQHLEGMVRCGRITKVKTSPSVAATVTYPDRGFQSQYLVVLQRNTIGHQDYYVPVPGEPVWVLMQGKSQYRGLILGSAYTDGCPPPFNSTTVRGMKFADGSYIIYDTANSGNYQINLAGKMTVTAATTLTITTKSDTTVNGVIIDTNGNVTIPGTLTVKGNVTFQTTGSIQTHLTNLDGAGGGS